MAIINNFTKEECDFLLHLLDQLNVKPTAPDALASVTMIQSIKTKIETIATAAPDAK